MSLHAIRPWRQIDRRTSRQIMVGNVPVGGDAPITVQTMTNTITTDIKATIEQVQACAEAGADIVRVSAPDEASAKAEKHLLDKYAEPCPEAMIESGLDHIRILEDNDFQNYKISCKASDVFLAAAAYQGLAEATDAPIHLGITEAGGLVSGTIKSAIGLGNLLWMGIGDTIRVSLSADPVEEVKVGYEILKSLGLRHRGINIISCPSCARQGPARR